MVRFLKRWKSFSIKTLLCLTFIAAVYLAGYRKGLNVGQKKEPDDFDHLIQLITSTIKPEVWDEVGGPGTITDFAPNCFPVTIDTSEYPENVTACGGELDFATGESLAGNSSVNDPFVDDDPFGSTSDGDPFGGSTVNPFDDASSDSAASDGGASDPFK